MKRIILSICLLASLNGVKANDYLETYNAVSESHNETVNDLQIIRQINGGTIIIPEFDSSCPEEMKEPFMYACKIVEEYMLPCLPLRVSVSCGRINGSRNSEIISRVSTYTDTLPEYTGPYRNLPMSQIKAMVLAEISMDEYMAHYHVIPNKEYLTERPDIKIVYNTMKLDEISFSLDMPNSNQYDFVSVAIRDLLRGLGLSSGFTQNPITKGLENPSGYMTHFERIIDNKLGKENNAEKRMEAATKGSLNLTGSNTNLSLSLYAPSEWQNGASLNYFIPTDDCCVSQSLSYEFGRGTVVRNLSDKYAHAIFYDLLGWRPDYLVGIGSNGSYGSSGSSSLRLPYNGSMTMTFDNKTNRTNQVVSNSAPLHVASNNASQYGDFADYIDQFHPYMPGTQSSLKLGTTVSILKKDGTWDIVLYSYAATPEEFNLSMSELTFHCDMDEYARSADGHLRARATMLPYYYDSRKPSFITRFFVIDYLPQKIHLSHKILSSSANNPQLYTAYSNTSSVRLYFSGLEGATKVILERLRPGARVPSKTVITDFKRGYYDTTIDRTTTFTAVAYNDNGTSRGEPIEIKISTLDDYGSISFQIDKDAIYIHSECIDSSIYKYIITPLEVTNQGSRVSGQTTGTINISKLQKGNYVLSVATDNDESVSTFKFHK